MTIQHDNGEKELVYTCSNENGEDLGVNATNQRCIWAPQVYYPLSQFDLKEWEIVQ